MANALNVILELVKGKVYGFYKNHAYSQDSLLNVCPPVYRCDVS